MTRNANLKYYAPLYFDFQDVRLKMAMDEGIDSDRGKVNIKKFLHVLYMELLEKMKI